MFPDTVVIGLEHEQYNIEEGDEELEVCALVKSGSLEKDVVLSFCTEMATAIGS